MAGDWIPIGCTILSKREVLILAARLGWSRYEVVGRLVEFWVWVSNESTDGTICGLAVGDLWKVYGFDRRFVAALCEVGWLIQGQDCITIPNFHRWLHSGAKQRLMASERKRRQRNKSPENSTLTQMSRKCHAESVTDVTQMSRCERDKSVTREEKRREENRTKVRSPPLSPPRKHGGEKEVDFDAIAFPLGCDRNTFSQAILEWLEYRRRNHKPYRDPVKQVNLLIKRFGARLPEAIEFSIANGYQGCFLPDNGVERHVPGPGQRYPGDNLSW